MCCLGALTRTQQEDGVVINYLDTIILKTFPSKFQNQRRMLVGETEILTVEECYYPTYHIMVDHKMGLQISGKYF